MVNAESFLASTGITQSERALSNSWLVATLNLTWCAESLRILNHYQPIMSISRLDCLNVPLCLSCDGMSGIAHLRFVLRLKQGLLLNVQTYSSAAFITEV